MRGALQGGLQAGALSAGYADCTWKIALSSITQGAASFGGQLLKGLGEIDTADKNDFWSDAAKIGGTLFNAGGWAAIRFGYYSRAPGGEDWGCSRYECFHNDDNVVLRPDEVTGAIAADYSLVGGCRGPSIDKWQVSPK